MSLFQCPKCFHCIQSLPCLHCNSFETINNGMQQNFYSALPEIETSSDNEIATGSKINLARNDMRVDANVIVPKRKRNDSNDKRLDDIQDEKKRRVETCKDADKSHHVQEEKATSAPTNYSASVNINSIDLDPEFTSIAKSPMNYTILQNSQKVNAMDEISDFGLSTGESLNSAENLQQTKNVAEDSSINQDPSIENSETSRTSLGQDKNWDKPSNSMHLPQQIGISFKEDVSSPEVSRNGYQILFYNEITNESFIATGCEQNKEVTLKCKHCDFATSTHDNLKYHLITKHNMDILYQCDKCEKHFRTRSQLKIHYGSHMGKKIFQCDECDYVSDIKLNIKMHKSFKHQN